MVTPVSGPFEYTVDWLDLYFRKTTYKQRPPYDLVLPYRRLVSRTKSRNVNITQRAADFAVSPEHILATDTCNQVKMVAYERLMEQISNRASMGENVIDFGKSVKTIETRAVQLYRFTKAIKSGHFGLAANILRTPEPKVRHPIKESANNWLEYHLGIEPVIRDIYNAIDVMQKPIKDTKMRGRASGLYQKPYTPPDWWTSVTYWDITVYVQYQVEVAISNPNLWLANSLGVLNPAQVLWQVQPLSFVLDWFVNVEAFLGYSTAFLGLTTKNPITTVFHAGVVNQYWSVYGWTASFDVHGMTREPVLTLPSLGLRKIKLPSPARAATAIALLIGGLKSLDTRNPSARLRASRAVSHKELREKPLFFRDQQKWTDELRVEK